MPPYVLRLDRLAEDGFCIEGIIEIISECARHSGESVVKSVTHTAGTNALIGEFA